MAISFPGGVARPKQRRTVRKLDCKMFLLAKLEKLCICVRLTWQGCIEPDRVMHHLAVHTSGLAAYNKCSHPAAKSTTPTHLDVTPYVSD
jgi:hypothetical protein